MNEERLVHNKTKGFTLVEISVYLALLTITLGILTNITLEMSKISKETFVFQTLNEVEGRIHKMAISKLVCNQTFQASLSGKDPNNFGIVVVNQLLALDPNGNTEVMMKNGDVAEPYIVDSIYATTSSSNGSALVMLSSEGALASYIVSIKANLKEKTTGKIQIATLFNIVMDTENQSFSACSVTNSIVNQQKKLCQDVYGGNYTNQQCYFANGTRVQDVLNVGR